MLESIKLSPPAEAGDGGHAGIIPAADRVRGDELQAFVTLE